MTSGSGFHVLQKSDLLAQLAAGHSARVTVVTPNQRLAAALSREFDDRQIGRGLVVWETADVLPFSAFVERLYGDALYSELAAGLPLLLSPAQELALWEDIVRSSEHGRTLLSAPSAAALASEAWQVAHAWRLLPHLRGYPANDDARAFTDWAHRYELATRRQRHCDRARLGDVVVPHLAHAALAKPAVLVAYGFDLVTPQQREFLDALARVGVQVRGCGPEARAARVRRVAFPSARDEIRAAARWARDRLEAARASSLAQPPAGPGPRIGVVVPDIAQSRHAVQHIFAQVMAPGRALPERESEPLPFNISIGKPLSAYPLAAAALQVLDIALGEVEFSRASRLVRSPFIAGAEAEMALRARLDAALRQACGDRVGLESLRRAIRRLSAHEDRRRLPACEILAHRLTELSRAAREHLHGGKRPSEWVQAISALLHAVGFPGERQLDSAEYQTLMKLHQTVAGFAALDRVAARMRAEEAFGRLARITADTPFQPEAADVPIQVLGVLESAGLEFDHLWVMGLTDEAWPIAARPNPLIPVALQRAAGVPEASAAASFDLDARITRGWLAAAGEVVLSHPLAEEDRELMASPLIRALPAESAGDFTLPEYQTLRDAIYRARREERRDDATGPALAAAAEGSGGTGVFRDQAACPFRAFAMHRLRAEGLEAPPAGPDAAERGTLVHAMLAHVWQALRSKAALDAASGAELDALLAAAADHATSRLRRSRPDVARGRFVRLEKERLVKLGRAWLELERGRPAFEVEATEHKRTVAFGGVTVTARLDRLDRLLGEGAGHAVIDYKTGAANPGDWLGERPDDPQLPLYALSGTDKASAVAYARVKPGNMAFLGIARTEGLIPGVVTLERMRAVRARDYASWDDLLEGWRHELEAIGREFAAGEARVDPRRGEPTCRNCELKPLCRISERAGGGLGGSGEG